MDIREALAKFKGDVEADMEFHELLLNAFDNLEFNNRTAMQWVQYKSMLRSRIEESQARLVLLAWDSDVLVPAIERFLEKESIAEKNATAARERVARLSQRKNS